MVGLHDAVGHLNPSMNHHSYLETIEMTKTEFFEELELILNEDEGSMTPETMISDIPGWDSTGLLGVIALLDGDLGISADVAKLRDCTTISDLIAIVGDKLD